MFIMVVHILYYVETSTYEVSVIRFQPLFYRSIECDQFLRGYPSLSIDKA